MNDFSMQQFKDEMITLVKEAMAANSQKEAMAANSQKEFIEFSSGTFRCRVRLDKLETFLNKLEKLPNEGVTDPVSRTHKQNVNRINRAQCAARLKKDNY